MMLTYKYRLKDGGTSTKRALRLTTAIALVALGAPALAASPTLDTDLASYAALQTYALQCKEDDFPKLTDASRLEVSQGLARAPAAEMSIYVSRSKAAEETDHVKFCRTIAAALIPPAVRSVPLPAHDIAKACAPDNLMDRSPRTALRRRQPP